MVPQLERATSRSYKAEADFAKVGSKHWEQREQRQRQKGEPDSEHRNQLVERYFPHASHQGIILSTDTEIEEHYFEQLKPSVARAYHLNYDEAGRMTTAEEGYFWKGFSERRAVGRQPSECD